jgi:uncharacterized protein YkwD
MGKAANSAWLLPHDLGGVWTATAHAQEFAVPSSARTAVLSETNACRTAYGLAPMRQSGSADRAARQYARYLALKKKMGHWGDRCSLAEHLRAADVAAP